MSEYVVCDTIITDLEALKDALVDLGVSDKHVEVWAHPVNLEGWHGDKRSQQAHVVIRRKYVGVSSNDIGFEFVDGKYKVWVSSFDKRTGIGKAIYEGINQAYAKQQVLKVAKRRSGCQITSTERDKDGKIRIRMRLG